ncbi:MAG: hypothetical protein VX223_14475 [Myxococcota bacterium]|nr:hypothetical protein [Myxococcota bacterium]
MRIQLLASLSVLLLSGSGCSSQEDPLISVDASTLDAGRTDQTDGVDSDVESDGTDGQSSSAATDSTDGADGETSSGVGANSCESDDQCSGATCASSVCVITPDSDSVLTDNTTDEQVDDTPNLDCVDVEWSSATSETVTIYGIVDRFGAGRPTTGIEVSVFLASDWPPVDLAIFEEGDTDAIRNAFRNASTQDGWTVLSTEPEASAAALPDACDGDRDCPIGYECMEPGEPQSGCEPEFGLFEIANVPANVPLIIRATSKTGTSAFDNKWKDTYSYNLVASTAWAEDGNRVRMNALLVSDGQWQTVPNTLGLVGGIKGGNGAVGGRVRDCGTDARRGYTMSNVSIGLQKPGKATGYFNTSETDTVPLVGRNATNIFGRYTAVDVPSGPNRLAALAQIDGVLTSLGSESFYLVPDSLAVITLPGKVPVFNK